MTRCPEKVVQTTLPDLVVLCRSMRPDEIEQAMAFFPMETWDPDWFAAMTYLKGGPKFTLLDDSGVPVIAGGYESVSDGVMRSWMVGTTDGWSKHWRSITKATRWMMDSLLASGIRRLETSVLASRGLTCHWYEKSLKMSPEGIWKGYGRQGQDVAAYARTAEN